MDFFVSSWNLSTGGAPGGFGAGGQSCRFGCGLMPGRSRSNSRRFLASGTIRQSGSRQPVGDLVRDARRGHSAGDSGQFATRRECGGAAGSRDGDLTQMSRT